jgi:hypothetical protein
MNQESNVRTVQALYAAFGRGDVPAVLEGMDPEITWVNPGPAELTYFGTHRGRNAVANNIFAFLGENVHISVLEPKDMIAGGDKVVVLLHMEATARKTGRRVVQEVAHVWTFKNGLCIHFHDFQDNAAVSAALRG